MNDYQSNIITHFRNTGLFSEIDIHFAGFIARFSTVWNADIFLAAALVSRATANGDICLDLETAAAYVSSENRDSPDALVCPPAGIWRETLFANSVVGRPGDKCPLILDDRNRLYLYRYWDYEKKLSDFIIERTRGELGGIDRRVLKKSAEDLFPEHEGPTVNWQKLAAIIAVLRQFSVITGGPGSGKSYTIAGTLALLLTCAAGQKLHIILAAPTGKAAARLGESIKKAKQHLNCAERIKNAIPGEVYTIHRLLKPIKDTPYFRHNVDNPLPADIVVIDEASMVDLALMSKLSQAIAPEARLLLVGDKDQLASVEAGSVLGDICDRQVIHGFSQSFIKKLIKITRIDPADSIRISKEKPGLQDSITVLQKSYRFSAKSGIGGLSRAVNHGDSGAAMALLKSPGEPSVSWIETRSDRGLRRDLARMLVEGYRKYLTAKDPLAAMNDFGRFQILCVLRKGAFGVYAFNRIAERVLSAESLISCGQTDSKPWYPGRPVLITENDYNLGLFNGDIGITLPEPDSPVHELHVYFPIGSDEFRRFPTHRLPGHETVYAMTVHKSQGSEFDHVVLVLPDKDYPLLTRELIYTALTRARRKVSIWGTETVLKAAIRRKIERTSGLREALWSRECSSL